MEIHSFQLDYSGRTFVSVSARFNPIYKSGPFSDAGYKGFSNTLQAVAGFHSFLYIKKNQLPDPLTFLEMCIPLQRTSA